MGSLGAILAVLEASWRPSWAILAVLEAIWATGDLFSGWLAGWAEAPLGSFWKGIDCLENSARQAPLRKRQGAADRRRLRRITAAPCLLERASVAQSLGFLEASRGFLGVPWAVLGRFGEVWGRPGGLLGELGGILGASWAVLGHLEAILGRLWCILGRLGDILRPSWALLGPSWGHLGRLGGHLGRLGGLLGRLGALLGPSWGPPGPSWSHLGGILGALGAILGAFWAVLGRRKAEKKELPKSFKNLRKINDFGLFGPSWRSSWRHLRQSWRPLGGLLGRLGPS